ncbi:MAG: hypothetical protein HY800_07315 [Ignavibacteriales bacterium]|nr:hypothetical protein [Ignavibacteriales bacterium]
MENHYLQSNIVLVLICFFVGSIAHPQPITEQILPEIFPYTQTANISFDNMNNIHLISLSTQIITTYPYSDEGLNILSYTRIENDSIVHITAIPDTGTFYNWGLGGYGNIFKHSIKPYRDSILLGWSKQQYSWGDVYPFYSFSKPRLHFVSIIAGNIQPLFDVDNAQAPNIVAASNGVLHFIWETDTAKNSYGFF